MEGPSHGAFELLLGRVVHVTSVTVRLEQVRIVLHVMSICRVRVHPAHAAGLFSASVASLSIKRAMCVSLYFNVYSEISHLNQIVYLKQNE